MTELKTETSLVAVNPSERSDAINASERSVAVSAAETLKRATKEEPTIKTELSKLFGRSNHSFVPSSAAVAELPSKKKRKKAVPVVTKVITAVCLKHRSAFVPRRTAREILSKQGRIRAVKISESMTDDDVKNVLFSEFSNFSAKDDTNITLFYGNKANDLAIMSPESGRQLFEIINKGCLYFIFTPVFAHKVPDEVPVVSAEVPVSAHKVPVVSAEVPVSAHKVPDEVPVISAEVPVSARKVPVPDKVPVSAHAVPVIHEAPIATFETELFSSTVGMLILEHAGLCDRQEDVPDEVYISIKIHISPI